MSYHNQLYICVMIPRYLYVINDPPCNSAYAAKRVNKRLLLLLLLLLDMSFSKLFLLLLSRPFRRRPYECCLFHCFPLYPSPYFPVAFDSFCTFSSMSSVTGLRRGRGRRRKCNGKKRNLPPFFSSSRSPVDPFLRRLPALECLDQGIHFGSIFLFLGIKENKAVSWKSATLIFFQRR